MQGRSWRRRVGPLAVAAAGLVVSPALGQSAPRPGDLPVTRLAGPEGAAIRQGPPPQRPASPSPLPITQLDERARSADLDGPRLVSLKLSTPQPLNSMLQLLVTGTPFSVVTDDAVQGSFSGELKDLTMRQALEAVLFPRGLDYDVQGTLIRVFPRKTATRLFEVNYLNLRSTWQRGVRSSVAVVGQPAPAASSSSTESDLFDELTRGVQTLLSGSGRAHVDRGAGLVQVTDFADRLDQIGVYLEAVQLRATRQVRIEARVFEVTLTDAAALSIDWKVVAERSGGSLSAVAGRGPAGIAADGIDKVVKAIQEQGTVRMIAAPQSVAMNNEPALMRVGTEDAYFVESRVDASGRTERTFAPATVMEGLTLAVTPQVAPDGIVQLAVAPTYAEKTGRSRSAAGESVPVLRISEAESRVRVRAGETVVIAGFLQDRAKVNQNAGLAGFFGAQKRDTVRSELVILLTPTIVTPGAAAVAAAR